MRTRLRSPRTRPFLAVVGCVLALILATVGVGVLHERLGIPNASAVYLLAVVSTAVIFGIWASVATAVGAFLAYDFLFISPQFTLTVADPGEWLTLVLLLVVGVVVGQLAGLQRARADVALAREREARALFSVSRTLATARDTEEALPGIVGVVASEARMERVWVTLGDTRDRVVADTGTTARPRPASHAVLRRSPGDQPARWIRIHAPEGLPGASGRASTLEAYRIQIESKDEPLGSLWATRERDAGAPDRSETRLMSAAADQIAGALDRERLAVRATEAEVARRSEALKTALLDSVSHDLRTPLATIRAAAGTLMDPHVSWDEATRYATAAAIDREAGRLNRLVSNLLDMSRIEAGSLRPRLRVFVLDDLVAAVVERLDALLQPRRMDVAIAPDLPPVMVDDVYLDQMLTNLLENVARYTPPETNIVISAAAAESVVRLSVEDDGPGVPTDALPHIFEKFYRVPRPHEGSRRGTGIGLAVVRGLAEAIGGTVVARARLGGGLRFELTLVAAGDLTRLEDPGLVLDDTMLRVDRFEAGVDDAS